MGPVPVVFDYAAGIESREVVGPAQAARQAAPARGEPPRREAAAFNERREVRPSAPLPADHVDDAGESVRAIESALRAACQFHALGGAGGQGGEIEVATELVDLHAVNHHQVVVGVPTANEHTGHAPVPTGLVDLDAGEASQHFIHAASVALLNLLFADDVYRRADLRRQSAPERCRNNHALLDGAQLESQLHGARLFFSNFNVHRGCRESRSVRHQAVATAAQPGKFVLAVRICGFLGKHDERGEQGHPRSRHGSSAWVEHRSFQRRRARRHDGQEDDRDEAEPRRR